MQSTPIAAEIVGARVRDENCDLTSAQKNCVLTSSVEDVEDLSAFLTESSQCLNERSVEKFIGDESLFVEEVWCGYFVVGVDGREKMRSVRPKKRLAMTLRLVTKGFP